MPTTTVSAAEPAAPIPLLREPIFAHGRLALGPLLDEPGHAYYQLADYQLAKPRRMRHGLIVGNASAGVTNLATVLTVTARAAMPLVTVYIAHQPTDTNAALASRCSVLIQGRNAAQLAVDAMERAVAARTQLLDDLRARSGNCGYDTAGLPALLVIVENAEQIFDGHGERWNRMLWRAGDLGIGVLAAARDTYIPSFGGSKGLRDQLEEQLIALRTHDRVIQGVVDAGMWRLGEQLGTSMRTAPTGVGRVLFPVSERAAFTSFRFTRDNENDLVQRVRRAQLGSHPDAELDAPTQVAFAGLLQPGGRGGLQ